MSIRITLSEQDVEFLNIIFSDAEKGLVLDSTPQTIGRKAIQKLRTKINGWKQNEKS